MSVMPANYYMVLTYHNTWYSHRHCTHMDQVTELDGVIEQAPGLKEEQVVCWVLRLAFLQGYHLGDVGKGSAALQDHPHVHSSGEDLDVDQTDVDWRQDVIQTFHTAYVPGCRERGKKAYILMTSTACPN